MKSNQIKFAGLVSLIAVAGLTTLNAFALPGSTVAAQLAVREFPTEANIVLRYTEAVLKTALKYQKVGNRADVKALVKQNIDHLASTTKFGNIRHLPDAEKTVALQTINEMYRANDKGDLKGVATRAASIQKFILDARR